MIMFMTMIMIMVIIITITSMPIIITIIINQSSGHLPHTGTSMSSPQAARQNWKRPGANAELENRGTGKWRDGELRD
eukprot:4270879-Pyramimonas_sp.AAC.1